MAFRLTLVALAILLLSSRPASAEWQLKPFLGATFGGGTTLLADLDRQAGHPKLVFGASNMLLGEVVGVEADFGFVPGFFNGGHLVVASSVTTLTGNVVVALPQHMARYSLRPYIVGGAGLMRVHIEDFVSAFPVSNNMAALDFGAGATGFVTNRIGVSWDVRYFHTIHGKDEGISVGPEELSFWRANMAVAIRY